MTRIVGETRTPHAAHCATTVLVVHCLMVAWVGCRTSPNVDEVGHLPAGIYTWHFGRFDVYRVNPPLVRTLAALPVVLSNPKLVWERYQSHPQARPEWDLGRDFVRANDGGNLRWMWYFIVARWMCLLLSLTGGYVCWRWAGELYGPASGLLALTLWCFCPNVITWAATICPDVGAAALGVAAAYLLWRWLREPTWSRAGAAGIALGLALLTKTTWIILFVVWPVLWLTWRSGHPPLESALASPLGPITRPRAAPRRPGTGQFGLMLLLALYVLNLGYGFEGSCRPLGQYAFVSRTLAGDEGAGPDGRGGNRFSGMWLGALPVPVPENYLLGMDLQKLDFERSKASYLCGEWKSGGWWYYYLVAAVVKVPLGIWFLAAMAVGLTLFAWIKDGTGSTGHVRRFSAGWRSELTVLLPALAVLLLVSSQTGFSRYFRYVLPCFPFAFIWISKVALTLDLPSRRLARCAAMGLVWAIVSSVTIYPHSLSYFNELTGGPRWLLDGSIDWGQDIIYLKEWLVAHPEVRLRQLDVQCSVNAEHFGIIPITPVSNIAPGDHHVRSSAKAEDPLPGWYAISVIELHGATGKYDYLRPLRPAFMAGYSIQVYRVGLQATPVEQRSNDE